MSSLLEQASVIITPNGVKAGKLYGLKGTDLDVVRATTATRVNESGLIETVANNVPRLDYTDGSCPSILVEPQRTNLVTYSEQFDNAAWIKNGTTINANFATSPSGVQDADKIIPNTGNTSHNVDRFGLIVNSNGTASVFLKASGYTKAAVRSYFTGGYASFDLVNGTILNTVGVTAKIENYGNGWYRCSVNDTGNNLYGYVIDVLDTSTDPSAAYIGDGTSGILAWGAQLEVGSYPTSYIPTVASAVTRNADVISKTGIADLIGQSEGVLFVDIKAQFNSADEQDLSISDGTGNNRALIRITSNGVIRSIGVFGGNVEFNLGGTPYVTGTRYKIALAYKNNDVSLYINGTLQDSTNTTSISGTLSRLGFDIFTNNAQIIVSPVNAVILFKTRLTNAQLATLTTL